MHSKTKEWLKPHLRLIDATKLVEQEWKREQLLEVRSLVERSLVLVDADGKAPAAAVKLRELLDAINAEIELDAN